LLFKQARDGFALNEYNELCHKGPGPALQRVLMSEDEVHESRQWCLVVAGNFVTTD
jgi:hypothetical protein